MRPRALATTIVLLAFYALTSIFAVVASNLWLNQNPLWQGFLVAGMITIGVCAYGIWRQFPTISRTAFFVSFGIAWIVTEAIQRWW